MILAKIQNLGNNFTVEMKNLSGNDKVLLKDKRYMKMKT